MTAESARLEESKLWCRVYLVIHLGFLCKLAEVTRTVTSTPHPSDTAVLHGRNTELVLCLQMGLPTDLSDHLVSAADLNEMLWKACY